MHACIHTHTHTRQITCQVVLPSPLFEPGDSLMNLDTTRSLDDVDDENEDARQLLRSALEDVSKDYNSEEEEMDTTASSLRAGKDRETVKDEEASSCQGQSSAGKLGGGLRVLFQVGAGLMNYGYLEVEPSLNIGSLLETEEALSLTWSEKGSESRDEVALKTSASDGILSLQGFLNICKDHLNYSEADVHFSKKLYEVIHSHGDNGVPRSSVKSHPELCFLDHELSLEQHIQALLNMEMVRRKTYIFTYTG